MPSSIAAVTDAAADPSIVRPARWDMARVAALVPPLEMAVGVLFTLASVYLHAVQRRAAGGLWRDEATSVQVANLPTLGQLWRYLEFDSYPPLFHLLLRVWCGWFSSADASLRVLGLWIGLGVLACFWAGARALNVRVPLFALVLLGLNPMMIRYGDSLRAYGLGCGLALLTFAAIWRAAAAERPDRRRVAVAMVAAVLSVQCLYHNAALLLAACLGGAAVALWRRRVAVAAAVIAVGVPAAVSLLPYLPIIARTRRWGVLLRFPVTAAWLWDKLSDVTDSPDPLGVWLWSALAVAGGALAACNLRSTVNADGGKPSTGSQRQVFAAVSLAAGSLIYAGFLAAVGYVTQPWYYLAFLAVAALCLDTIFGQPAAAPGWRVARLALAVVFAAMTFAQSAEVLRVRSTNIDAVAGKLNAAAAAGDLVLVNRWECAISLNRYYHGPARLLTVPPIDDHRVHRYDLFMRSMQTADPLQPVFDAIGTTLRGGGRVWLVGTAQLLKPGETVPRPGPVAVPAGGDWPFGAYTAAWEIQADAFLNAHAARAVPVDVPLGVPVNPFENQALSCFESWQSLPPAP